MLKWPCLGRLVVTSLRKYLQMHLMFLSNDSLQDPLHADAYRLVVVSVAAVHARLVISLGVYHSAKNYHATSKEVRSTQFANIVIFEEEAVTKSKSRQVHYPRKFFHENYKF